MSIINRGNNMKTTPIPVVPRQMRIVNGDGTVTRSGQLLLEQLQPSGSQCIRTLNLIDLTPGAAIAPLVPIYEAGPGFRAIGVLRKAITEDLVVTISRNNETAPLFTFTFPKSTPIATDITQDISNIQFNDLDVLIAGITASDSSTDPDGIATLTIEWIPAGVTPIAGGATVVVGGGGGSGPVTPGVGPAPNVLSTTTCQVVPYLLGNDAVFDFGGRIDLPVNNPNFAYLNSVHVVAFGQDLPHQGQLIAQFNAPFGGVTSENYQAGQFPQSAIRSERFTVQFICINTQGTPTPNPFEISLTVPPLVVLSLSAGEMPNSRWLDGSQLTYALLFAAPTISANQLPVNVTLWLSQDNGVTFTWINWYMMTTVGQNLTFPRLVPLVAQLCQIAAVARPVSPPGGDVSVTIPAAQLPQDAILSNLFTFNPIGTPNPNGVTNAVSATPVPFIDVLGQHDWGIPAVSWQDPVIDDPANPHYDPNAWYTVLTFQCTDVNGNPAPQELGGQEVEVQEFVVIKNGIHTCTLIQDYGFNPPDSPYHYAQLRIYTTNRLVGWAGFHDPVNAVVQNCWANGANYVRLDFAEAALLNNFIIDDISSNWPTLSVLQLKVLVHIPDGTDPYNLIRGGHLYIEIPDVSNNPDYTVGTDPIGGTAAVTGNWKPVDLGKFSFDPAQQPWVVNIDQSVANITSEETLRLYCCTYGTWSENSLVRATNPQEPSPSRIVTVAPPDLAGKPESATNVTELSGAITATVLPNDNSTGKLITPIAVYMASTPDIQAWVFRLVLTWDDLDPTDTNNQSVATGYFHSSDWQYWQNGLIPCGPSTILVPHTIDLITPNYVTTVTIWAQSGIMDPTGQTTATRWNLLVPGITPNTGPLGVGVSTGTVDLGSALATSIGPGMVLQQDFNTGYVQLSPNFEAPITLSPSNALTVSFKPPFILGPDGGLVVQIAPPLYTTVTGDLSLDMSTDFAVGSNGQLTQAAVNLALSYGFDTTNFQKLPGTGNFAVNEIAVNHLIAGNALFLGDTVFARQGGGQVVMNSTGLALANNQANPTYTVTLTSSEIQLAGGNGQLTLTSTYIQLAQNGNIVEVQPNGVLIQDNTGHYMSLTSTGIAIINGSSSVEVSSSGVQLKDPSGATCTVQSGLINLNNNGNIVQVQSGGILIQDSSLHYMSLSSTGVGIFNGQNSVQISSSGIQLADSTGAVCTVQAGVVQLTRGSNYVQVNATGVNITGPAGTVSLGSTGIMLQYGTNYVQIASSGVLINQGNFSLNLNGTTTTINNSYDPTMANYIGLQVLNNANRYLANVTAVGFQAIDLNRENAVARLGLGNAGSTTDYGYLSLGAFNGQSILLNPYDTTAGNNASMWVNGVLVMQGWVWTSTVQTTGNVFGGQFGIEGVALGVSGSFVAASGQTVTVQGGIITGIH